MNLLSKVSRFRAFKTAYAPTALRCQVCCFVQLTPLIPAVRAVRAARPVHSVSMSSASAGHHLQQLLLRDPLCSCGRQHIFCQHITHLELGSPAQVLSTPRTDTAARRSVRPVGRFLRVGRDASEIGARYQLVRVHDVCNVFGERKLVVRAILGTERQLRVCLS